ncbi:hypothetical protein QYM36_016289, partial [Artemia franciscana]
MRAIHKFLVPLATQLILFYFKQRLAKGLVSIEIRKRKTAGTFQLAELTKRHRDYVTSIFTELQLCGLGDNLVEIHFPAVKLKVKKAPGFDGVSSNHLRNGSPLLIQHMPLLFQMCIDSATVPKSFCTGVVTNILKKGKNANECGGYRPITVSSSLSKVLEKLVLREVISKCVIDYRHFGFRKHLSSDSLELSVHICSVDISTAFDSVIQSAVFRTLLDAGVNAHIVAMLSFWYSNSYIRVKLGLEKLSEPVKLKRGLRQGSVSSPILFNTLTSKVTKQISDGLRIDTCDLSLISYADDLLMLSFSLSVLQDNLDELVSGHSAIGLQVNGQKTEFLVFSSAKQDAPAPTVSVDGAIIAPSSSLKYLGPRYGRDKETTRTLCLDILVQLEIIVSDQRPYRVNYWNCNESPYWNFLKTLSYSLTGYNLITVAKHTQTKYRRRTAISRHNMETRYKTRNSALHWLPPVRNTRQSETNYGSELSCYSDKTSSERGTRSRSYRDEPQGETSSPPNRTSYPRLAKTLPSSVAPASENTVRSQCRQRSGVELREKRRRYRGMTMGQKVS